MVYALAKARAGDHNNKKHKAIVDIRLRWRSAIRKCITYRNDAGGGPSHG